MNGKQADEILTSMVAFIKQHGIEEVQRIEKAAGDEFTIQKNQYVDEEKKKISEDFKNKLANEEVRLKIEKSKQQNTARIDRMRKVNEYVETLRTNMKKQVREKLANDPAAYKTLLKDLLIQGLIKLMEGQIFIRCREADVSIIESIQAEAIEEYRKLVVQQVKRFEGQDPSSIPCTIVIDTRYLESIEDNEKGCIGGFKLFAKKGRIVCSQTIDDRIELCFQAAIPAIRYMLFPSMRRPAKTPVETAE